MSEKILTTAAALVAYRNELAEGGVSADLADAMMQEAGRLIISESGLGVHND